MATIANLQYGWTLFVDPIDAKHHWGRAAIQLAFTIFVVTETWLVPIEGWFMDKFGPTVTVVFGGIGIALGWIINSHASSLPVLYSGAVVSGLGASAIWCSCIGNALKWFPDRRGLAAGLTIVGFGAGAALTIIPIAKVIISHGYEVAFFWFGIVQGMIAVFLGLLMRSPDKASLKMPAPKITQSKIDFSPRQTLSQPLFWLMYLMFFMVASCGLMAIAQLGPLAKDFGIAGLPVSIFGLQMTILTLAISLDRILDGFGRPIFGHVSDRIGRENTMFIAFTVGAIALFLVARFGHHPVIFLMMTPLFFFVYGEIFTLFPSICTDTFGAKFATTNVGMLYTAKGTAAIVVPLVSVIAAAYGWTTVFTLAAIVNFSAGALAFFVLKPARGKFLRETEKKTVASMKGPNAVIGNTLKERIST